MNFKLRLGKIGIVLIVWNILVLIPLPLPIPFIFIVIGMFYSAFQHAAIVYSILISTIIAGLVLYIIGRKEFSDDVKESKIASGLLTFFGFILTIESVLSFGLATAFSRWVLGTPLTLRNVAVHLLTFVWCGLGFISGLLWLIDGGKMGEDKVLHLKKDIDFEEAWKKYPKDLFAEYVKQYPHNPTGVLEWHIYKKMKTGKTREQAIKKLESQHAKTL